MKRTDVKRMYILQIYYNTNIPEKNISKKKEDIIRFILSILVIIIYVINFY